MAHVPIVSPLYCFPHPIELSIKRRPGLGPRDLVVKDINGNLMFEVLTKLVLFASGWRILFDPAGNPIITLKSKATSWRGRWEVFRGYSTDKRNMIFSVRRHTNSIFQLRTTLDVFLANNTSEETCDFQIKAGYNDWSCTIYVGNHHSNYVVAEMKKKHTVGGVFLGNDNYMVTIQPNIDHAFIVALIVVLNILKRKRRHNSG